MPRPYRLFSVFGVEIEYAIVDCATLDVKPIADRLLRDRRGAVAGDVARGSITWCNELAAHVVELKTEKPVRALAGVEHAFACEVREINRRLARHGAMLMPTGMHPWMDPDAETRLWPHAYSDVYEHFNRVFDCRGHGWSNVQATQLNLPFGNDSELERLHAAVRLLLPILPALSASTPVVDGELTEWADNRMRAYGTNSARVPSVAGLIVPDNATSRTQYETEVLGGIYRELAPHDPRGVLRHEWSNARGAIVRFDRMAIEIRILDSQECPRADLAILAAISAVLRRLVRGEWSYLNEQQAFSTTALAALLRDAIDRADRATVGDRAYLDALGSGLAAPCDLGSLWRDLLQRAMPVVDAAWREPLGVILDRGPLARRIERAAGPRPERSRLAAVYRDLCACLDEGRVYEG
jgi:gamma-glutamyl:cysteine ligase YbdK (ATP-grasp superfamily)